MKDKELKFWTTEPNRFLVASSHDQVLGCVAYKVLQTDTVEVNRLSVRKGARGRGLGRRLMEALIQCARENGYSRFYLTTGTANESAIELYKRMGFREVGRDGDLPPVYKLLRPINGLTELEFLLELK